MTDPIRTNLKGPSQVDRYWNDDDVLPPVLSRDTEFVFAQMTHKALQAAKPRRGERVLDIGCGRGLDAMALARQGGILYGGDPSRVMLDKARKALRAAKVAVILVSHLAEQIPFKDRSFDRVLCKGAIDHFLCPEQAVAEMCRVTSPRGKIILAVANFESLGAILGRVLNQFSLRLLKREIPQPHMWKIPKDHHHRFGFQSLKELASRYLSMESIQGASLFWGFPIWTPFLRAIPSTAALILLRLFNTIASSYPPWGDILILTGRPLPQGGAGQRSASMKDTSRLWGGILCLAILGVAIVFLWGISVQNYWALAIPVAMGFLGILGLGFWIGWTILTIRTTPPTPEPPATTGSESQEKSNAPKA